MVCISTVLLGALASNLAAATASDPQEPLFAPTTGYNCTGIIFTDPTFICGDFRLGPVIMPSTIPINVTTIGFKRYGGLDPADFLKMYWNDAEKWWKYPSDEGYAIKTNGAPLKGDIVLPKGLLVDRFGGPEKGHYFSPFYSPFEQRALPPSNLNPSKKKDDRKDVPEIYWVYEVMKDLTVSAGPIARWFGQPGLGTQFYTVETVKKLEDDGFLKHRPWKEIFGDKEYSPKLEL